ncbi:MAG: TonB family protein [Bacteroidota bacterium]
MSTFVNYLIEANLGLVVFYTLYQLLMKHETDFRANRIYLLASVGVSLLFPLFTIETNNPVGAIPSVGQLLPELVVGNGLLTATNSAPAEPTGISLWPTMLLVVYSTGVCLFFAFFAYQLFRLGLFIYQSPRKTVNGLVLIETSARMPSFSFFRWIVIGQMDVLTEDERLQIITHETAHARQWHTADLLLISLVRIVCWFNPVVWMYKTSLEQLHEYEADAKSTDPKSLFAYCTLLAKVAMAQSGYAMTHHFNKSLTLKRIKMMNTLKKQINSWKVTAALGVAAAFFVVVACQDQLNEVREITENSHMALVVPARVEKRLNELQTSYPSSKFVVLLMNEEGKKKYFDLKARRTEQASIEEFIGIPKGEGASSDEMYVILEMSKNIKSAIEMAQNKDVFTIVEESATPGLGMEQFYRNIAMEIRYPLEARRKGIEGRVFVEFIVNEDGSVSDHKVIKGIHEDCDLEALRVLLLMNQKWNPGRQNGQFVKQRMVLPITFKLNNGQDLSANESKTTTMDEMMVVAN